MEVTNKLPTNDAKISPMKPRVKKIFIIFVAGFFLAACSTTGGIYSENDADNSEFSLANTLLGVLAVAGAVALANSPGGGSGYAPTDYDWAWDEFYNQYNQLVWSCRGMQTGQFAELDKCAYKVKIDSTWPSKRVN